jgi:hypothetical protein
MNETLQNQIASLLKDAQQAGKDAASFIQEQAPDLVQQLLRWKLVEGIAAFVVGVLCVLATYFLVKKTFSYIEKDEAYYSTRDVVWVPVGLGGGTLGIFGLCAAHQGVWQVLQVTFAPKIFLIEYVAKLAGS